MKTGVHSPGSASIRLDPYKLAIDGMLRADLDAPRKQRHTLTRIFHRLLDEYGAEEVSYAMVRDYVYDRRREIRVEEGRGPPASFIPQTHRPGDEAEVDFGDVWINLAGTLTKCFLFSLRLSYSGRSVHRIFASCGQEAFLEGHVHALNTLGGVPYGKIRYDNLRAAVAQVLGLTRRRAESERWTAFRSHYSITSFYCHPGIEGAHEKGGVEGQIGWFRRNQVVELLVGGQVGGGAVTRSRPSPSACGMPCTVFIPLCGWSPRPRHRLRSSRRQICARLVRTAPHERHLRHSGHLLCRTPPAEVQFHSTDRYRSGSRKGWGQAQSSCDREEDRASRGV
ncbi:hypothetical protein ABT224_11390 [Streptomyces sp. NPDC001584]|uniref:hypothetical protein n=1 Tax=Streptomyces sp. NPDC001584 TaxID=3154521 RepID=UPI00332A29BB